MESQLKSYFKSYGLIYDIPKESVAVMHDLFLNKKIPDLKIESNNNAIVLCRIGTYYSNLNEKKRMVYYYNLAVQKGSIKAMFSLASYYKDKKDYNNMKKYLLMCIERNSIELHEYIKNKINSYLDETKDYDYEFAFDCKKYLDKQNTKKLNGFIAIYHKLLAKKITLNKNECCICLENNVSSEFNCRCKNEVKQVCTDCYNLIIKCPICYDEISI